MVVGLFLGALTADSTAVQIEPVSIAGSDSVAFDNFNNSVDRNEGTTNYSSDVHELELSPDASMVLADAYLGQDHLYSNGDASGLSSDHIDVPAISMSTASLPLLDAGLMTVNAWMPPLVRLAKQAAALSKKRTVIKEKMSIDSTGGSRERVICGRSSRYLLDVLCRRHSDCAFIQR